MTKNMPFESVIKYLQNNIHPQDPKEEFEKAIKVLSEGQAYLTKDYPIKIIFYDDNASK